jgi:hypothetical protein
MCCFGCCFGKRNNNNKAAPKSWEDMTDDEKQLASLQQKSQQQPLTKEEELDYENLVYIAQKREIRVTIQRGTQAGLAAGLCVMGGVIVAGPVGAMVGGAAGTAIAMSLAKEVVTLQDLLVKTPANKKGDVYRAFSDAMKEEFQDGFTQNPELRLLLSGGTVVSCMRYALDRDLIENDRLEKLDGILKKIR